MPFFLLFFFSFWWPGKHNVHKASPFLKRPLGIPKPSTTTIHPPERDTPPRNYPAKLSQPRRTRPRRNTTNSPPRYSLGAVRETSRQSLRREIHSFTTLHPHSSTPMFGAIVNREYSPQRAAYSPAHPLTHPPRSQPRPGQADCLPGAPAFQALT